MDMNPLRAFAPENVDRNRNAAPKWQKPGVFADIMDRLDSEPAARYAAHTSLNDRTRSFCEMPIAAPVNIETRQTSSNNRLESQLPNQPEMVIASDDVDPPQRATAFRQKLVQLMIERLPSSASSEMIATEANMAGQINAALASAHPITSVNADAAPYEPQIEASASHSTGSARNVPFYVQLMQADHGHVVEIRTLELEDEKQQELLKRVAELASEYGLTINRIRISTFGRKP